jgi:NADPH:quinone reductase-like Zn-dependent oxidoreductase
VPGDVVAGEIDACGDGVDGYQVGERVLAVIPAGGTPSRPLRWRTRLSGFRAASATPRRW